MPSALLLNPWIYDFAAFDLWASPLGLLYIGAALREGGWETRLVDCTDRFHPAVAHLLPPGREFHVGKYLATEVPKPEAIQWVPRKFKRYGLPMEVVEKELLAGPRPDVVLVTSRMTYWYPGVVDAIEMCRRLFPETPVLLGGIYATLCREHARAVCRPDVLFEGEVEGHLAELIESATGIPLKRRTGGDSDAARAGGGARGDRDGRAELDALPRPAYDLLRQTKALPIETSRGCPFRCGYCASSLLAPRFRRKSPAKVVDEIEWMVGDLGAEDIAFYDDALLMDHERHFEPIADEIVRRNLRVRFHTPNSLFASMITPAVAEKMMAIGVRTVRISLETTSSSLLKAMNRKIFPDHFLEAMKNLKAAGFTRGQIGAYLLCGLPDQTLEDMREAVDFVIAAGAVPRLAEYSPIPRTAEWEKAVAAAKRPIAEEPLLQNNSIYFLMSGERTLRDLDELRRYALKKTAP